MTNDKISSKRSKMPFVIGIVLLASLILVNLIMYNIPIQLDLTKSQVYSLSNITIDLLRNLEEPLQVTIYISKDIPLALHGTTIKKTIQDLMGDFKIYGRANFDYTLVEIGEGEEDDTKRSEAMKLGIEPVVVEIPERIKKTTAQIIAGINITYENYQESMQINLNDPSRMEYELIKRIDKMMDKNPLNVLIKRAKQPIKIISYITPNFLKDPVRQEVTDALNKIKNINPDKIIIEEKIVNTEKDYERAVMSNITFNTSLDLNTLSSYINGYGLSFHYDMRVKSIPSVLSLAKNKTLFMKEIEDNIANVLPKENRIGIIMKEYNIMQMWAMMNQQMLSQLQNSGYPKEQIQQFFSMIQRDANTFENPSINYFKSFSEEFYDIEIVDLNEIENVADKYQALVVISTNATFTDWELFHIDRYIMSGKPIAFLVNAIGPDYIHYMPIGNRQQSPFASNGTKRGHNLYELIDNYGIKLNDNLIKGSQGFNVGGGYRYPLWMAINNYDKTPVTEKFNITTHFGWASSLDLNEETFDKEKVKAIPFLQTTDAASLLKKSGDSYSIDIYNYIEQGRIKPESENPGQYTIGYLLEGSFNSYYKNKNVPEKPSEESEEETSEEISGEIDSEETESTSEPSLVQYDIIEKSPENTKIVIISDRDFVTDWMAQFIGYGLINNIALIQNAIDWMINHYVLIPVRGKSVKPVQLNQEVADEWHNLIMWGNILGLPFIVILIGLFLWIRDYFKRERLFNEFNPSIATNDNYEITDEDIEKVDDESSSENK